MIKKNIKKSMTKKISNKITKDFKANQYIIPLNVMKEMEDQIKKTHETGKEHGMSLCAGKDHRINIGYEAVGTDRDISISEECRKKDDKYVGSYHTHPSEDSEAAASAQDLFTQCLSISNLDCVGKNEIGEIVCYEKKHKGKSCTDDVRPLLNIEDQFHDIPWYKLPFIRDSLYKEVDKLAEKKFDLHKVK